MTISNVASSVSHDGDGLVTDFPFTFPIRNEDDLRVSIYQISTAITTVLTLGQFSHTGIGPGSTGGSIHYPLSGSPLSSDYKLITSRVVPLTQDWSTGRLSDYDPATLEEALDRIVMGLQQVSNRTAEIQVLADDFEAAVNSVQALVIAANSAADTAEEWAEIAEEAVLGIVPDGTVSTIKLADGAVTTAKLADDLLDGTAGALVQWATGPKYPVGDGSAITEVNATAVDGYEPGTTNGKLAILGTGGRLDLARAPLGSVVASAITSYSAVTAMTLNIAVSTAAPSITAGTQVFSKAFAASSVTSRVRVRVTAMAMEGNGYPLVLALFAGNTFMKGTSGYAAAGRATMLCIVLDYVPGTTDSITYSVRAGPDGPVTMYLNGNASGAVFAGGCAATMEIEEIAA